MWVEILKTKLLCQHHKDAHCPFKLPERAG
jgi:hypothetical protein